MEIKIETAANVVQIIVEMVVTTMTTKPDRPQPVHLPPVDDRTDDVALLARYAGGQPGALGVLAERYERGMLGAACGLLGGDEATARDAVQAAWIKVIRHAAQFEGRSSVKTWLYRILINECRTQLRAKRPVAREPSDEAIGDDGAFDEVRRAVSKLDAREREIILLCYHRGMTQDQAADVLDIPVGTLKTRLRAAKEKLREMLGDM